jgi:protein-S-isoprenylcysteine O-methyltransferase Ste14
MKIIRILLIAILLFGGVFGVVPILVVEVNRRLGLPQWDWYLANESGIALMAIGVMLYVYCAIRFAREGRGTPSPIEPTRRLVTSGIFRYSRNPIYVGYVAFLLGLFVFFGDTLLLAYALLVAGLIHALVVRWEEPDLTQRFGDEYESYLQRTPRWIGLRRKNVA